MRPAELEWLAGEASKCDLVLEVGSYHGCSTTAMLDNSNAHIVCVDLWGSPAVTGEDDYNLFISNVTNHLDRLTILRGRSHDMLDYLIEQETWFDMVFIDGGHQYKNVYGDIERGLRLNGGLICGHDFGRKRWPGVVKAVEELIPGYRRIKETSLWFK